MVGNNQECSLLSALMATWLAPLKTPWLSVCDSGISVSRCFVTRNVDSLSTAHTCRSWEDEVEEEVQQMKITHLRQRPFYTH